MGPTLNKVTRTRGIAGQVAFHATATDDDGNDYSATFVGTEHLTHSPVVMILPSGAQVFVTEPSRFGKFTRAWVRAFFAE